MDSKGPKTNLDAYIQGLKQAWGREQATLRIYKALAMQEKNPSRKQVLLKLAMTEQGHADRWAKRLAELGVTLPTYQDTIKDRMWRWILVQSGTENALARIESAEEDDTKFYGDLMDEAPDETDRQAIAGVLRDEQMHQQATGQASAPRYPNPTTPQGRLDEILHREKWHRRGGGWIGQAIYGANDGLGSVFGIVSGVSGATAGGSAVLIAGLAGMLASALSMGSGAYLATKTEREVSQAEVNRERKELESHPEEEAEELSLFYQLKGVPEDEARSLANRLIAAPDQALKTLSSEELGLSEETFPNPWLEAISATLSTAFGAFIPIIPFFFMRGYPAVITSFAISTLAHFCVGSAKTVVTGLSPWRSGFEMMMVGLGEALVTYLLGVTFGRMVS